METPFLKKNKSPVNINVTAGKYPAVNLPKSVITREQLTAASYVILEVNDDPAQKNLTVKVLVTNLPSNGSVSIPVGGPAAALAGGGKFAGLLGGRKLGGTGQNLLQNQQKTITVWSGDAYDAAGQWTDDDLVNALTPLVLSQYKTID